MEIYGVSDLEIPVGLNVWCQKHHIEVPPQL